MDNVALFRGLTPEQRNEIASKCIWKSVDREQTIVHHLDESSDVYFLIAGRARVMIHSTAGRAVAFRDLAVGEVFGEFSAIDGRPRSASVEALDACLIAVLPSRAFRAVLERQPTVTLMLLEAAIVQIRSLTDRFFEISTLAVNNRIHAEVLRLALAGPICGNEARIMDGPTHFEMANRISTSREAVTRELNRLEAMGVITRNGRHEVVCKLDRLRHLVDEAAGLTRDGAG